MGEWSLMCGGYYVRGNVAGFAQAKGDRAKVKKIPKIVAPYMSATMGRGAARS